MKSPLIYLLEVLFCSGMLLALYRLLLLRKVSFAACRRYLVAAVVLSVAIPALNIPLYPARTVVYPLPLITAEPLAEELPYEIAGEELLPSGKAVTAAVDWPYVVRIAVMGLYLLTTLLLLGLLAARVIAIRRLRRQARITDHGDYTLAEHSQVGTPFSFLRTVFLGEGYEGLRREIVVCHERSHVRHRHSTERIAVELVRCLFWFNPFVWMAGRWLSEVQEWEADRDVLDAGYDLTQYRTIVFRQLFGYNPDIACGLNNSLTKNRFAMMTQPKERRYTLARFGAAIPVVAAMMLLCSFTTKNPEIAYVQSEDPPRAIPTEGHCPLQAKGQLRGYGEQVNPLTGRKVLHPGVDIAAAEGTPVLAAFDGRVTVSEFDDNGKGNYVVVDHPDNLKTYYAHLAHRNVSVGDRVRGGEQLGTVGSTGLATGPHLHFEFAQVAEAGSASAAGSRKTFDPEQVFDFREGTYLGLSDDVEATGSNEAHIRISANGEMRFNGLPITAGELKERLAQWRGDRTAADNLRVSIQADKSTEMGVVSDTKEALRSANILRVSYYGTAADPVKRVLPPYSTTTAGNVNVVEANEKSIVSRNLFVININSRGQILAGPSKALQIVTAEQLPARIKTFLLNASDDPAMAEKVTAKVELPAGDVIYYPVSRGILSMQVDRATTYDNYVKVQSLVEQAYTGLRDEAARDIFEKPFSELSDAERQTIQKVVPMTVSEAQPRNVTAR
ncbi:peptidoglycan DD-metalloendopeptidase family protein [uncultured Alistipes sp.]|uniref:peptidoglycan DD-metalloendopeptidase family protein n=1 Tax=uncultured Alistipes sp. TaxID=538949 RepID=UPI00206307F7|nr:peptidoglycan DD-metalloendopeptidase family protein [uncultured Alistipes sp.]DAN30527.1 MAG TPA: peptidase [Crassvirales sp.]